VKLNIRTPHDVANHSSSFSEDDNEVLATCDPNQEKTT
jgi:hypothetical protein